MSARSKRIPFAGEPQRGWLRAPPGTRPETLVALARASDALCSAALATAARLEAVLPGALDEELRRAAADYAAAAAAMDEELRSG